ncbi:MAG: CIA30 family protein, partial [Mycobacterium sp.]
MWNDQRRRRAWTPMAIMCVAVLIVAGGNTGRIARADPAVGPAVLVDFGDPAAVAAWTTVNDPVMGGRSTSAVTFGDGGL